MEKEIKKGEETNRLLILRELSKLIPDDWFETIPNEGATLSERLFGTNGKIVSKKDFKVKLSINDPDITKLKQRSDLLQEVFDITQGAWDDPVISEDLYDRIESALKND